MLALFILSLALAMDAFAVSLVHGATGHPKIGHALELGLVFGIAQGLMPLIGWGLGQALGDSIASFDHWVAFILLGGLGVRMLVEAFSADDEEAPSRGDRWLALAAAAFATSVDAAVAGLTLPLLGIPVGIACVTIGATTAALCTVGYLAGSRVSGTIGKGAEILGGMVLIGLGIKILAEHLRA